jgi:hypothetical protein
VTVGTDAEILDNGDGGTGARCREDAGTEIEGVEARMVSFLDMSADVGMSSEGEYGLVDT